MQRIGMLIVASLAVMALAVACGGGTDASSEEGEPAAATTETAAAEDTAASEPATTDAGEQPSEEATTEAGDTDPLSKIPSLEGKTIAYIQTGSVEYFDSSMKGARAAVEELGGELVVFNSEFDAATELENVRTAITQGVDGILLFSVSRGALESSARLAKEAGIPVSNYYGYVEGVDPELVGFWTGANPYEIGKLDGQAMAVLLNEGDQVAAVQGQLVVASVSSWGNR